MVKREHWDVVVIGAGVAGAVAACRLARRDLKVLLLDKASWPRDKVCGGCVNAAALKALADVGVDITSLGSRYSGMRLAAGGHQARFALPPGRAITRRLLDATLVKAAVAAGAAFSPATKATLGDCDPAGRTLHLRRDNQRFAVRAKLVLACNGLAGRLLDERARIAPASRIGAGAIVQGAADYAPGIIHMACARNGYVGLVRVEANQLNVGAALDPVWVKRVGGPAAAVGRILKVAGLPAIDALAAARWRGTPHLSREQRRLGAERLLALGDATGYVEPFTGEGMAWAIASAAAIEPLALAGVQAWRDDLIDQWTARQCAVVRRRQRVCGWAARALRRPRVVTGAVRLAATMPGAAAPLTAWLNHEFKDAGDGAVEA